MSETKSRFAVLDGTALKLIAMVCMAFDHVGDNFFPDQIWMRIVGRIAMPLFAFCAAEGFSHTHDRGKYLKRMGLFALISEIPFDLVTAGKVLEFSHQNIMFSFLWAFLCLTLYERVANGASGAKRFFGVMILVAGVLLSVLLGLDYNMLGVGLIFIYYLLRERLLFVRNVLGMAYHLLLRNVGVYIFGLLGFLPVFLYNGKKGKGLKWLFYCFYPGHLLLIWLVRTLIQ